MHRRILTLLVFRAVLFSILSLVQAIAPLVGINSIPFSTFFTLSIFLLLLNWIGLILIKTTLFHGLVQMTYLWGQVLADVLFVSTFVFFYGQDFVAAPVFYVFVILVSTLFFPRVNIYIVAIISFVAFHIIYTMRAVPSNQAGDWDFNSFKVSGAYFIVYFTVALLGNYLKKIADSAIVTIDKQSKEISRLQFIQKNIVESLTSGLISVNMEGRITYANPAAYLLLEEQADLLGKEINQVLANERFDDWQGTHQRMQIEVAIRGRRKTFGFTFSEAEWEKGEKGSLILFQDLTRIKQLEEQQAITSKMAAIGKVAAGVAHEIRNPLAAISGSVQVISSLLPENPTVAELIEIVQKETGRLNQIINQFLVYANPLKPEGFKEVNLGELLHSFLRFAKNDTLISGYEIQLKAPEEGPYMLGNSEQITQILWNLLRNSCQASEEGDKICIELNQRSEEVRILIEDHGVGMTSSERENLFTPFQRFRKGPGLGLGLSIVFEIVQLHNGKIFVTSEKGQGTQVEIYFPCSQVEE